MKVYIVVELRKNFVPRVIDVFKKESDAYKCAAEGKKWRNVITREVH